MSGLERDRQAEQDHAEWRGWLAAQGYDWDDDSYQAEAFAAGMQARRDLGAQGPVTAATPGQAMAAPEDKTPPEYQLLGWAATLIAEAPGMQAGEWETATRNWLGAYAALTAAPAAREPHAAGGLAALREQLARAKGDRNAARNVVAEMLAHWQRDGATPEQEELFPQWLAAAGLTDGATAQPQPAPGPAAAERDALREAVRKLHALFGAPDSHGVVHAVTTRKTLEAAAQAAVAAQEPHAAPGDVKAFSWAWREQPPMNEIAEIIAQMTGGTVCLSLPETGSDEYELVISRVEPAPELAGQVRLARADRDQLRKQVLDLAAELETSAARTVPSKKTDIENATAAKLRKAAEPPS